MVAELRRRVTGLFGPRQMGEGEQTPLWLATLLDEHGRALVLYARQWCNCPDDVVQQALLELVRQKRRPEPVLPWLYRVVRNAAISASRQEQRRAQRESKVATSEAVFETGGGQLDAQAAAAALTALAIEVREVIVARIWGDLTFAEIAALAGTSLSTVQRRYEQGIRELQAKLERSCTTKNRPTTKN